ncbi:MAG: hypothetical protein KJN64_01520 [Ignavibacteria bacterium]|nr:hypothetical protein [Ignavibacteria bacterium]MBT8381555.1 hypothetical protein [Ignavibacteria bacterium]MBT8390736.1 hypothetical protein [Ignavibacteria bacterium]NNJ53497.1 hypothetical protein [Ignavibacteriaceae bacterium]NNL20955.1 hypothetical protein [Ignavibacteriaceae bacterium]
MKKILIADPLDQSCISVFESAGFALNYSTENSPESRLKKIKNYNALLVRSTNKITSRAIVNLSLPINAENKKLILGINGKIDIFTVSINNWRKIQSLDILRKKS